MEGSTSEEVMAGWIDVRNVAASANASDRASRFRRTGPRPRTFLAELNRVLGESNDPDFVYNANETGLYFKVLPSKSLASRRERAAPSCKMSKQRVTVMVCSNASENHEIPLKLIGESKNPRCFKGVKLPLAYRSQRSAWMSRDVFDS